MPVKKNIAPAASVSVLRERITTKATRAAGRPSGYDMEEAFPHRVFHARPRDIAAGLGFSRAKAVSWRYLQQEDSKGHRAHEVRIGSKKGQHHFRETGSGLAVDEMKALLEKVHDLEALKKYQYELAFLRLGALRISAVWLRAYRRHLDYFIPLSPAFHGLEAGKLYPASEFLPIAREAARRALEIAKTATHDDMMGG